jgi:hypothetical protein
LKLIIFPIFIFFLLFVFSCTEIKKEDEENRLENIRAGNAKAATTMNTGKLPSGLHDSQSTGYVKDQIIVKFLNGTGPKTISAIQNNLHLETLRTFSSPNLFLMKITDHTPVENMIKSLSKYKEVKYSEPNYKMSIDSKKGIKP